VGGDGTVITESYFGGTSTFDSAAQTAAVDAMQDDARAQNALLGLYNFSVVFAVSPQVQGFAPFRYGMYYPDAISMT
jgi:ABC-type transport system substrate-binding protein